MKYKDFDGYKINESKIMDSTMFSDFELSSEEKCDFPIFKMFSKHTFVIVLKSGRCYTYSKEGKREKIWDVETLEKNEARKLTRFSIIGTENGQFIKEQYEKMSNLTVVDVIQYIKDSKGKKDKGKGKRPQRLDWITSQEAEKTKTRKKPELFPDVLDKIGNILNKDKDDDDKPITGGGFKG